MSSEVPTLHKGDEVAVTDEDKATMLMETFFPAPASPVQPNGPADPKLLDRHQEKCPHTLPEITEREMVTAINTSNPRKAAGRDEITFLMARLPRLWKVAKIVIMRKPGKPDYTVPKAFRPISLLCTLSKGMEKIMAARLSYLAEEYRLLPLGHFGARPKRSCEMALVYMVESIADARRSVKVLAVRLRDRKVPARVVDWITDFLLDRHTSVAIGSFHFQEQGITHPGIPQGSPLSPLLYIFYNADLIDMPGPSEVRTAGFVDDFTAWATGRDTTESARRLQEEVLPMAKTWAEGGGAVFEAGKTGLTHFIAPRMSVDMDRTVPLTFLGKTIGPQESIKLLGFHLRSDLSMGEHAGKKIGKAMRTVFAISRLKGLRPRQARQVYEAAVLPVLDYGAAIWFAPDKRGLQGIMKKRARVENAAAKMIIGAFRSVSGIAARDEAGLEPASHRLARKVATFAVSTMSVPQDNPIWAMVRRTPQKSVRWETAWAGVVCSNRRRLWTNGRQKSPPALQVRRAWAGPPWLEFAEVYVASTAEEARRQLQQIVQARGTTIFTDGSRRGRLCGIATILQA
ncbi:Hypothetical protein D9617_69g077970 [Elsinoe fawcettii]|nr:Hypothetical protein D9617_69g077970 [Elsinoe fawcettii]